MIISLYSLAQQLGSSAAYFTLQHEALRLYSPWFSDTSTASAALRTILEQLRTQEGISDSWLKQSDGGVEVDMFSGATPVVSSPLLSEAEAAVFLEQLTTLAQAPAYTVQYHQLGEAREKALDEDEVTLESCDAPNGYFVDYFNEYARPGFDLYTIVIEDTTFYYFNINGEDGEPSLHSYAFANEENREQAIQQLIRQLREPKCLSWEDNDGGHVFSISNKGKVALARSTWSAERGPLEDTYGWLGRQALYWATVYLPEYKWEELGAEHFPWEEEPYEEEEPIEEPAPVYEEEPVAESAPEEPEGEELYEEEIEEEEPLVPEDIIEEPELEIEEILEEVLEETGDIAKVVKKSKTGIIGGMLPPATTAPCAPIFPLFRPFRKDEKSKYHGREEEVEELFEKTFDTRLLVVHSEANVGKTSLIQCGLANRIESIRWQPVFVRRGLNINTALQKQLVEEAREAGCEEITDNCTPELAAQRLYEYSFKPVYLIVDQLEELFIHGDVEEQQMFFRTIKHMVELDTCQLRVILAIRDEYLAQLGDYETVLPDLLDHRFHLLPMKRDKVRKALNYMFTGLISQNAISVPAGEQELIGDKVYSQLPDCATVNMNCLQIYLHQLHQLHCPMQASGPPVFSVDMVEQTGPAKDVTSNFLDTRIQNLEDQLDNKENPDQAGIVDEIDQLTSLKASCACDETKRRKVWIGMWHERKEENDRLRRLLWLCLGGLILAAMAMGLTFCAVQKQTPCSTAWEENTCEAFINHLCHHDQGSPCAEELIQELNARDCQIWNDYQEALTFNNCESYVDFMEKYRARNVCTDAFSRIIVERACAIRTDTMVITNIDTIYETREVIIKEYDKDEERLEQCKIVDGKPTFKLGPIRIMTEDLNGGTLYDWVTGLNACRQQGPGWRLPCVSEIDYILDEHYNYTKDPANAYDNINGGSCPVSVDGLFWTATEASDQDAWAIHFDEDDHTVELESRVSKSRKLPCRCIKRDPTIETGTPICLDKEVFRN